MYSDPGNLKLFCGTYNVNGKADLRGETLDCWLFPDGPDSEAKDMYVLGFQVRDLFSVLAVVIDHLCYSMY